MSFKIITKSDTETIAIASKIGKKIKKPAVILLDGELGSGKTTFSRGLGSAFGLKKVSSPSFTILKSYKIDEDTFFNHLDLYRLDGINADFDLEEYIDDKASITVVEWPFKVESLIPGEYLLIRITYINEKFREFEFIPVGKRYEELINEVFDN